MTYRKTTRAFLFFLVFFIITGAADAAPSPGADSGNGQSAQNQDSPQPGGQAADSQKQPLVQIPENVGGSLQAEATDVGEKLKSRARSLFVRKPMGWNADTLQYAYRQLISLPSKAPVLIAEIHEQSRVLGVAGSMVVLVFILAVAYGVIGRRRILARIQNLAGPVSRRLPEEVYPYFQVGLRSVAAALIPLLLFGAYLLIKGFIDYSAPWFLLVGSLLKLWTMGALRICRGNRYRDRLCHAVACFQNDRRLCHHIRRKNPQGRLDRGNRKTMKCPIRQIGQIRAKLPNRPGKTATLASINRGLMYFPGNLRINRIKTTDPAV